MDLLQNNFDPVTFLEIDTTASSVEEVFKLRTELNKQIGEYLILKLSQSLTGEQQDQLSEETHKENIIAMLKMSIPNLDERIQKELDQFKIEFKA